MLAKCTGWKASIPPGQVSYIALNYTDSIILLMYFSSLLLLLMPVMGEVKFEGSTFFRLSEKPTLAKLLSDFMLDMLLLPYG